MTKNSAKKTAARAYQTTHPRTTFPEALRAVDYPAADGADAAPADAQPGTVADDDWPIGRPTHSGLATEPPHHLAVLSPGLFGARRS
ncbi:hypothetical protein [Rhodococcus koreensis]